MKDQNIVTLDKTRLYMELIWFMKRKAKVTTIFFNQGCQKYHIHAYIHQIPLFCYVLCIMFFCSDEYD